MSIGAPADDLTTEGQTWGAPPLHPARIRENAHQQFRDALRCHMRVAGVVRIDHVMGLQRLFWVPRRERSRRSLREDALSTNCSPSSPSRPSATV